MNINNYKVFIEYDGTGYNGLQKQKGEGKTVQGEVEKAAGKALSEDIIDLNFCGRTDSGVHALEQVLNIKTRRIISSFSLVKALNYYLALEDIAATFAETVDLSFHARRSCKARSYTYKILNRNTPSPLLKNYAWLMPFPLDVEFMRKGAEFLIGTNDFSYFRASGCWAKTPIRTIEQINIKQVKDIIEIQITAPSFLYKMIRNIVGALVKVGRGQISYNDIQNMTAGQFTKPSFTAPAHGLYFLRAYY